MLKVDGLESGYDKKQVLFGISLRVDPGEIVAIIGPNGCGKSTTLKAIIGLIPVWSGDIEFDGCLLNRLSTAERICRGITFALQGSRVFQDLTVEENIRIGGHLLHKTDLKARIEDVLELFPVLKSRVRVDAGRLSGGEQQMVALARSLVPRPRLLLLDEPSLGLSPKLVGQVFEKIIEINQTLGVSILVVEQKVREILGVCDKVYSLKLGRIAYCGVPDDLKKDKLKLRELFL